MRGMNALTENAESTAMLMQSEKTKRVKLMKRYFTKQYMKGNK